VVTIGGFEEELFSRNHSALDTACAASCKMQIVMVFWHLRNELQHLRESHGWGSEARL
jgi:hypothetical protein